MTGSAVWHPITLDSVHSLVGGHPATITDNDIQWESMTANGFGGATRTRYLLDRNSGRVAVGSVYTDPKGNSTPEPGNYTGECYVSHRPF
ncbi:MAG TPA: hypothetical protein VFI23_12240 [Rhizomicrobium sp.]|nr:hypothetical protein [Rhizomicrobium sp.]